MTPWEDGTEILQRVMAREWTPELFERCRNNDLVQPCIFNQIRQALTPAEYEQFDRMYCEYVRPGQKGLIDYLKSKRQHEGGEEQWRMDRRALLQKKKQLLKQELRR